MGTHSRAQGCVLGISLEPGRSRQGSEHDLENPYRDEKVQSASTFLRRLRTVCRPAGLTASAAAAQSSNKQLLVMSSGDCFPPSAAGRPSVPQQGWRGLRVCVNLRDRLLKLTISMHLIYK